MSVRSERASGPGVARRRRVLFVGSSGFDLPLSPSLARKWDALSRDMEVRVIGRSQGIQATDPRFRLVPQRVPILRSLGYYASLLPIVGVELRRFRPDVVITKSPHEAFALLPVWRLARPRPKLVVELHGDWRAAPRLYGSPLRRVYCRLADRAAVFALRRADATRAVSEFTASLSTGATGRRPLAVFPTYFDLESFTRDPLRPLPNSPAVAWIGVLQPYKNPRLLADAWRLTARQTAGARLVVVGEGPLQAIIDELAQEFPQSVIRIPRLTPAGVAKLLDESTVLAVSSQSEGLPRVIMEAFARGRPVVSTVAGGIPDIVEPGRNGMLVARGDAPALADALVQVLTDTGLATRLSRGAVETAEHLRWTPDRYGKALRELVESALAG
jgi:glycosyltransferase involved in cell wall biosynthesis